jgi:hypothetical protein
MGERERLAFTRSFFWEGEAQVYIHHAPADAKDVEGKRAQKPSEPGLGFPRQAM